MKTFKSVKGLIKDVSDDKQFNKELFKMIDDKRKVRKTMEELKIRIRKSGLTVKEIAKRLEIKYSTLSAYLNDFNPMPEHVEKEIKKILKENK